MDTTAEESALRREITKTFQIHAFELKKWAVSLKIHLKTWNYSREAVNLCVKLFLEHDKQTRKKWTNKMIELLKKQTCRVEIDWETGNLWFSVQSSLISEELIRETFRQCKSKGAQDAWVICSKAHWRTRNLPVENCWTCSTPSPCRPTITIHSFGKWCWGIGRPPWRPIRRRFHRQRDNGFYLSSSERWDVLHWRTSSSRRARFWTVRIRRCSLWWC